MVALLKEACCEQPSLADKATDDDMIAHVPQTQEQELFLEQRGDGLPEGIGMHGTCKVG